MDEWKKVSEELPKEDGAKVLLRCIYEFCGSPYYISATYNIHRKEFFIHYLCGEQFLLDKSNNFSAFDKNKQHKCKITHWAKIIPPITEEEK